MMGAVRPADGASGALVTACRFAPLVAALALAWSLRGAPLGTPAADDFEFMSRTMFGHRPHVFDSMGATYYWRPLTRQVWFSLFTPLLFAAPWAVAAIQLAVFGGTAFVLGRVARGVAPAPADSLVTAAVLLSEPARTLISWPSGIQHLLAAFALALTAHETLAGRRWTAAIAALAAALSHELGGIGFLFVALGRPRSAEARRSWLDPALGGSLAVAIGAAYYTALAHGVQLPSNAIASMTAQWWRAVVLGFEAASNAETLPPGSGPWVLTPTLLILAGSIGGRALRGRRGRPDRTDLALGLVFVSALAGFVLLAGLLPDWNEWRAYVSVVALTFSITTAAARVHPWLALMLVGVRLLALDFAQPASGATREAPKSVSDLSFARLTRIQRVLGPASRVVRDARLPAGARIAHWGLPKGTINGFRGDRSVQVWLRDPRATLSTHEGAMMIEHPPDLVLAFDTRGGAHPVVVRLSPEAHRLYVAGHRAGGAHDLALAVDLWRRALAAQSPEAPSLSSELLHRLAIEEASHGRFAQADSLNRVATSIRGVTPDGCAIDAYIALAHGDLAGAGRWLDLCLGMEPRNAYGLRVQQAYERMRALRR